MKFFEKRSSQGHKRRLSENSNYCANLESEVTLVQAASGDIRTRGNRDYAHPQGLFTRIKGISQINFPKKEKRK